jgi:hypothetical protein
VVRADASLAGGEGGGVGPHPSLLDHTGMRTVTAILSFLALAMRSVVLQQQKEAAGGARLQV